MGMGMIKFPFMTMQQLNLDWILQQLKTILKFMPINSGSTGDVLQRTNDGAAWRSPSAVALDIHGLDTAADIDSLDELPIYDVSSQGNFKITVGDLLDEAPVTSVNGQTGDVVLSIPAVPVDSVNGQTGTVVLDASDVGALPDTYTAPVTSVNGQTGTVNLGKSDVGLGSVDNVQQYSANNPPPYPVTSVNGQTGDVVITPGGGMEATLLWTNSAPTSTFAAQNVALDLSDCKFVLIEYSQDYGFITSTVIFPVPTITPSPGYSAYNVYMNLHWVSSQFTIFQRRCSISAAGIVFEDATEFTLYNTSGSTSTNNNLGVPKRIWGIV